MTDRDPLDPQHKIKITFKDGTESVKAYASASEAMEAMQWILGYQNVADVGVVK